ncbi:hypothetical protein ACIQCR_34830 [Streptomyces sp. NPDC093249]|uniref:hypothetical protein n=1 Tax=unclassified Streptomyces TaxID=2593676 RepID=UPI003822FE29
MERTCRPVFLPSSASWTGDARLVGQALDLTGSAASGPRDPIAYVEPPLTWQIAAETITDSATTSPRRPGSMRILLLRPHVLRAAWACHAALRRALGPDDDAERLAGSWGCTSRTSTTPPCPPPSAPSSGSWPSSPSTCQPPMSWPPASP